MFIRFWMLAGLVLGGLSAGCTRSGGVPSDDPGVGGNPVCVRDADCGHDFIHVVEGRCCPGGCSPRALTLSQLSHVAENCDALGWGGDQCPVQKCNDPPPVACVDGRCTLKTQ